uniref:NECAP endocytosis associated 2 n=1 Tax=Anser brachyrhynchus TaxID=132585 RepID=A0A8B9B9M1_9AVES
MAAAADGYEAVLCVKPAVHVYRLPPRASNRGYRAAEWQLERPAWSGRLRVTARGTTAFIRLEDKASGELFAQAPVEQFPGIAVESVTDSSRYFVIRIEDGNVGGSSLSLEKEGRNLAPVVSSALLSSRFPSQLLLEETMVAGVWNGRRAFIGVGFVDRGDAFDFNVALQDHFKWVKQQSELAKQAENPDQGPKLDLGFKEGQTIKLNIASMKKKEGATGNTRPRPAGPGGLSLLPPPPGGKSSSPAFPSGEQPSSSLSAPVRLPGTPITDSLLSWPQPAAAPAAPATDVWGDFAKASGSVPNQTQANAGWVQF